MEKNDAAKQIAGAIIIAGVLIAGAILLKNNSAPKAEASIAKQIGLKEKAFNSCVAEGKFKNKVEADISGGIAAGVNGTPTSFILKDGKVYSFEGPDGKAYDSIPGAQPYEIVMQNIKRIKDGTPEPIEKQLKPVSPDDHILGSADAKIIVVEYSDLDCPFCKTFHNTMHRIVKENTDVAWVYRHFPIPKLHPNAKRKAEETECASEQKGNDGFWKYTDKVFEI
ncbi:thioredoxin domain-containing protein [Candidatus Nomurabacteria bacterium]|nr:thioredoxin domain-containing protein [Candidatus Nomurabacteria bacterium]